MVEIDVTCNLESFRRFLVNSTCRSYIPESYLHDPEVFPEKEGDSGSIYIEAVDKIPLKTIRDITFVNAQDVLGIIYTSKSGNSRLKWRQLRNRVGRVTGDASNNSLVNLSMTRVISPEFVEEVARREMEEAEGGGSEGERMVTVQDRQPESAGDEAIPAPSEGAPSLSEEAPTRANMEKDEQEEEEDLQAAYDKLSEEGDDEEHS